MRIRYCGPVRARRELICTGDEARVSRIFTPDQYNGMVERLSQVHDNPKGEVVFHVGFASEERTMLRVAPSNVSYHLLKFISLNLARSFYPENIVNAPEIRFFRRDGKLFAATYSDFVPDETGVIQRRAEAASRFYASPTDIRDAVLSASDENEHRLNPELENAMANIRSVGVYPAHPEANYHVTDGRTVFFEIDKIDLPIAYQKIITLDDELSEQHWLFAIICAVIAKEHAIRVWKNNKRQDIFKPFDDLRNRSLRRLATFFDRVFHTTHMAGLFDSYSDLGWFSATNYETYNSSRSSICGFSKAIDKEVNDIFFETSK